MHKFNVGDKVEVAGWVGVVNPCEVVAVGYMWPRGYRADYYKVKDTMGGESIVQEASLTPVPLMAHGLAAMAGSFLTSFKVGDYVSLRDALGTYEILGTRFAPLSGDLYQCKHIATGVVLEVYEAEIKALVASPVGKPDELTPKSKGDGCECGAWISSWPNDHMQFCPKFKGDN